MTGSAGARLPAMAAGPGALPTGTVTFLLTDVEASTAAWQRAPEVMPAAVARLDALLDQAITAHGGVRPVEQGEGDSVVAAFERPSDAIAAALEAQQALQAEPWPDGAALRVRMAIHTGEIVLRGEGNYGGTTLHRCARLRACAHGGQVVVSRATAELVLDRLPDGAGLVDLGPHQLKDLVRPELVYQLTHPDLARDFPPLRSLDAHRHNLPLQTTPLIGRAGELAAIAGALDTDRLVTLTGSAGIGKTRLAVHAAAERAERHPDGVAFVELATVNDPSRGGVDGGRRAAGVGDGHRGDRGCHHPVRRRPLVLVVLDNCEHVIDAAAELAYRLLAACPQTHDPGHQPRAARGARRDRLAGAVRCLPPPSGDRMDVVELSMFDAVRLFADRARRARPGFTLTDPNAGAVGEICSRLDGIPLALELAAARCRAMTPHKIAEELDRRFLLLTGGARTVLARQQTLLASVEWSHELLAPDERAVFRRLGAFTGPFPLDAAEAVCGDAGDAGWAVFDVAVPTGRQVPRRARPRHRLVPTAGDHPPLRRRPLPRRRRARGHPRPPRRLVDRLARRPPSRRSLRQRPRRHPPRLPQPARRPPMGRHHPTRRSPSSWPVGSASTGTSAASSVTPSPSATSPWPAAPSADRPGPAPSGAWPCPATTPTTRGTWRPWSPKRAPSPTRAATSSPRCAARRRG